MSYKVLIIHGYAYQRGGTVTFLRHLVKYLDRTKFEPIVLFLSQGELVAEFQSIGIPVKVINSGRLSNVVLTAITIGRILWLIYKERIDIVFSNDCREHLYGGTAAYLAGIPATFFWQGFFSSSHFTRLALFIPSIIFVYNSETKRAVECCGRKAVLILPGIEIPNVVAIHELPLQHGPVITQVALFMSWKGHSYFIEAADKVSKIVPDAKFLIVGNTPNGLDNKYEDELHKLVKELEVERSVVFMGYRKDVREIISLSDIIVHPVIAPEPFGYAVIEAMAAGKPVIASKIGTPKEFIEDGVNGILVPPRDFNAIADAILKLLKDDRLRQKMGISGRRKVEKYFQAERMVREIEYEWENLI